MKAEPFNREKQHSAKRKAVIMAAGRAFAKHGYHNTSMADIATALGLTRAALYYYVNGKEEILFECHILVYDAMDEILRQKRKIDQSGLNHLVKIYRDLVLLMTQSGLPLLTDVHSLTGRWQSTVKARRKAIEYHVTDLVKLAMDDGSIQTRNIQLTMFYFMGALNWLNAWYDPDGDQAAEVIAEHFCDQLRTGLIQQNAP